MYSDLKVGDLVVFDSSKSSMLRGSPTMEMWISVFAKSSDTISGVFRVANVGTAPYAPGQNYPIITLSKHIGACVQDWWLPAFMFKRKHDDWLEDLDLASQLC